MSRELIEAKELAGQWACSNCEWPFEANVPIKTVDPYLDKAQEEYQRQRDQQFAAHACADYGRKPGTDSKRDYSRTRDQVPV